MGGQSVKCPGCGTLFVAEKVRSARRDAPPAAEKPKLAPAKQPVAVEKPPAAPKRSAEPKPVAKSPAAVAKRPRGDDEERPVLAKDDRPEESWSERMRKRQRAKARSTPLENRVLFTLISFMIGAAIGVGLAYLIDLITGPKDVGIWRYLVVPVCFGIAAVGLTAMVARWDWYDRALKNNLLGLALGTKAVRVMHNIACAVFALAGVAVALLPFLAPARTIGPNPAVLAQEAARQAQIDQALLDAHNPDPSLQAEAVGRLRDLPAEDSRRSAVLAELEPLLDSKTPGVRGAAIEAMGRWGTSAQVPKLLAILNDKRSPHRAEAIQALGKIGDDRAIEPISKALTDTNLRKAGFKALRRFKAKAEPVVLPLLTSTDAALRLEVCKFLRDFGGKESLPALEKAKGDKDEKVATAAENAIDGIKSRG
jgi:hypothetical protein